MPAIIYANISAPSREGELLPATPRRAGLAEFHCNISRALHSAVAQKYLKVALPTRASAQANRLCQTNKKLIVGPGFAQTTLLTCF